MPKFQAKRSKLNGPRESAVITPEDVAEVEAQERAPAGPQEQPVCGINNCDTWYPNPEIMARHRERQHGLSRQESRSFAKPRDPNSLNDPGLTALRKEGLI